MDHLEHSVTHLVLALEREKDIFTQLSIKMGAKINSQLTVTEIAEVVLIPSSAAEELSDPMQVYCPACEVRSDGVKERVVTAIVSFLIVSISFCSFPETVSNTVVHWAEGTLVSPEILSLTVQVRMRPDMPATVVSDSDILASANKLPTGTASKTQ